jgi:hypothetical protein
MPFPSAPYNAKPAPVHTGDYDAVGFSTVFLTSSGFAALQGGASGQQGAAAKPAGPAVGQTGLRNQAIGIGVAVLALLYLDQRIAKR